MTNPQDPEQPWQGVPIEVWSHVNKRWPLWREADIFKLACPQCYVVYDVSAYLAV